MARSMRVLTALAAFLALLATTTAQCPDGSYFTYCLVDPCMTVKCTKDTVCVANYCGGCHAQCVPRPSPAANSSVATGTAPAGTTGAVTSAVPKPGTTSPAGGASANPQTRCQRACTFACIRGSRCYVDPVTCEASCKPVDPADASTTSLAVAAVPKRGLSPATTCPGGAPPKQCRTACNMMCIRGFTCAIDSCTCRPTCKPIPTPTAALATPPPLKCPNGLPPKQCSTCSLKCSNGTRCQVDRCSCQASCKPIPSPKPAPVPKPAAAAASIKCPNGSPPTQCRPVCNMMCMRGTRCQVDPCTCQASCKPVPAVVARWSSTLPQNVTRGL